MEKGILNEIIVEDFSEICGEFLRPVVALKNDLKIENLIGQNIDYLHGCGVDVHKNRKMADFGDFKLFVSWKGTDKDGNVLVSWRDRFMNFRFKNLQSLFDSIAIRPFENLKNENP